MRAILALLLVAAGCGGPQPARSSASTRAGAIPLDGLEAATFGASVDAITAAFPAAAVEGERVTVDHAVVERLPAVVLFDLRGGALRGATVAFDTGCDVLADLAASLDARLGARTSAEADVVAWNHAGWDLALYCADSEAGEFLRLDVRPAAAF